jgi:uracil-DNA glycosylase
VAPAGMGQPWPGVLDEEIGQPYFRELAGFVERERANHEVFPPAHLTMAAFDITGVDRLKVVLLGQDPYPQPHQANGLCFSVPRGEPLPKSLVNIHKLMRIDGFEPPTHGDLSGLARQGVLLLNTALTVRRGQPGSHAKVWQPFTDAVIRLISSRCEPIVFVLWGRAAQRKLRLIDRERHPVVAKPHPAARGASQVRFQESQTFSTVNDHLRVLGHEPIDWSAAG